MANLIYAIAIAQFLLGAIITVLNLVLWFAVAVNPNLRTATHCLLGNMWFANLLLGIIVALSNVVDQSNVYVFQKTEGTVAIVNGFVIVSMLLALTTNRVCAIRNPNNAMSTRTSFKIIIATWAAVLSLTLIKAIVYGLNQIGTVDACFKCFLSFEVSTLVIFTAATLIAFFVSVYFVCGRRNRTVGDSNASANTGSTTQNGNYQKEFKTTITIGLLLFGFSLTFLAFVFLIPAWLTQGDNVSTDAAEIIITLFYTHCLINPIIALIRDEELRKSARQILRCQRPNRDGDTPPTPLTTITNATRHSNNNQHQQQQHQLEIDTAPQSITDRSQNQNQRALVQLPPIENPHARPPQSINLENEEQQRPIDSGIVHRVESPPAAPTAPPMEKEPPRGIET